MLERELVVDTPDGPMTVFAVHPQEGGPFPVAILYMDAVGYREQLKGNARRFAEGGYYCLAPDLFHHFGDGVTVDMHQVASEGLKGPEIERMFGLVQALTPELVAADTDALIAAVGSDPAASPGSKVTVGYCMGARFALMSASMRPEEFVAAAGVHPGPLVTDGPDSPHHYLDTVKGELYFAFAEKDEHAPPEMVERLREELRGRGIVSTVERVPGTFHGFAMADVPAYNEKAAEEHFERTLELWGRNLEAQPTGVS